MGERTGKQTYPRIFSPGWLRRFLFGLAGAFAVLAIVMWVYNAWAWLAVARPASLEINEGTPEGLKSALARLETPHVFSGYEPWHDFGDPNGKVLLEKVIGILAKGREYTPTEIRFLSKNIAWYVPAFRKTRIDSGVPVVEGDRSVISTLLDRWLNAHHTGIVFAVYLTIAAALLGTLCFLYVKLDLFRKLEQD